jgi:P27 family predicted phage terminase small subunit
MGRRGPKPMPRALKLLRGNPGRRPLRKKEPSVLVAIPDPPPHLDAVALAEWHRITPVLAAAGLVTLLDRGPLAAYCMAWSHWVAAEGQLRECGSLVVHAGRGGPRLHPLHRVVKTALEQLRVFGAEFGMTPASRSRLEVAEAPPENALERFVRRHRGAARSPVRPEEPPA